ncbi:MAG: hypothetical protein ACTHMX_08700 [Thermomicrobiales bacterium]
MDEPSRAAPAPSPRPTTTTTTTTPHGRQAQPLGDRASWLPTSAAWWGGLGFLRFHCALFLTGIPLLFLVNLILSPERIWIDRFGLAWLALLVVHAAIAGIIRAMRVLRDDAQPGPSRETATTAQPRSTWITARSAEPQDADYRVPDPTGWGMPVVAAPATWPESAAVPSTPAPGTSVWDGWTSDRAATSRSRSRDTAPASVPSTAPQPTTPPGTSTPPAFDAADRHLPDSAERVSWRKVAEAAWLTPADDAPSGDPSEPTAPATTRTTKPDA